MVIFQTRSKGEDGKRSTYHVSEDGKIALCSFASLADAALALRFLAGGNLSDRLTEKAMELMEGVNADDAERTVCRASRRS